MITEQQLANRIIGASWAATLLGVSRYKTQAWLYNVLTGAIEEDDIADRKRVRIGNALEDLIIDFHDEATGLVTQRSPDTYIVPDYPWATVHLDGIAFDDREAINVECKKVGNEMRKWWGEPRTDQIDPEYIPQVQMQMWAADCHKTHVAALIGDDDFRIYEVDYDPEMGELIACVGDWMWERVQRKLPVPIDYEHVSTLPMLKKMYPGTNGETIELDDSLVHWWEVWAEASAKASLYDGVVSCARAHVLEAMGENAIAKLSNGYEFVRHQIKIPEKTVEAIQYIKLTKRKTRVKRGNT